MHPTVTHTSNAPVDEVTRCDNGARPYSVPGPGRLLHHSLSALPALPILLDLAAPEASARFTELVPSLSSRFGSELLLPTARTNIADQSVGPDAGGLPFSYLHSGELPVCFFRFRPFSRKLLDPRRNRKTRVPVPRPSLCWGPWRARWQIGIELRALVLWRRF